MKRKNTIKATTYRSYHAFLERNIYNADTRIDFFMQRKQEIMVAPCYYMILVLFCITFKSINTALHKPVINMVIEKKYCSKDQR